MALSSGNSTTHGPHHVAQTLMRRNFPELFFTSSLTPASSINSTSTGSLDQSSNALFTQFFFSAHFIEHPNTFVVLTVMSLPCSNSSIAFLVSNVFGVLVGFSTSSILPW